MSVLADYQYFLQVCCYVSIHLYILQNILTDVKWVLSWVYALYLSLATVKGNGTESVISARCTQPFTFPGISLGENSAHQLLISPGTLYCRVDRGTMGWEVCPTLLHLIISVPLPALPPATLPPSVQFYWLTLPPSVRHSWLSLPPSVRHGWLFLATISQTRLTFPCHQQSDTADFSLPPVSRTPCPVAPNVLDIQSVHLRAIYSVHFRWMNIAVCKQMSGWLILDTVHLWKPTHSWTLYHFCHSISIFIKHISLFQQMWYDTFWCDKTLS